MRRLVTIVVALVIGLYAFVCVLVYLFQDKLLYFPDRSKPVPPSTGEVEEVTLVTSDGVRLGAWYLAYAEPSPSGGGGVRRAVVFCHGNAGNIGSRLEAARWFRDVGASVLLFDYRGYGASENFPTEEGTYRDAEAAFDHLVEERGFAPERIAIYGESLGAAVATELALRRRGACLVLESAFTSIPDMGREVYPFLPVGPLSRIRYDNLSKLPKVDVPVLVVHSPEDEIVPFEHGKRLRAFADEFLETRGGHNDGGFLLQDDHRGVVARWVRMPARPVEDEEP